MIIIIKWKCMLNDIEAQKYKYLNVNLNIISFIKQTEVQIYNLYHIKQRCEWVNFRQC